MSLCSFQYLIKYVLWIHVHRVKDEIIKYPTYWASPAVLCHFGWWINTSSCSNSADMFMSVLSSSRMMNSFEGPIRDLMTSSGRNIDYNDGICAQPFLCVEKKKVLWTDKINMEQEFNEAAHQRTAALYFHISLFQWSGVAAFQLFPQGLDRWPAHQPKASSGTTFIKHLKTFLMPSAVWRLKN